MEMLKDICKKTRVKVTGYQTQSGQKVCEYDYIEEIETEGNLICLKSNIGKTITILQNIPIIEIDEQK